MVDEIAEESPEPVKPKMERCGKREKPKVEYLPGVELRKS